MVSVLHTNLISCRVGFVLSFFYKSNFSCTCGVAKTRVRVTPRVRVRVRVRVIY